MIERTPEDIMRSNECNTYVMSCHLNRDELYKSMRDDIATMCDSYATLKSERDELLAERARLFFHERQLAESLKSYMHKYGPGYSSTDCLAYDNARGVLDAIAKIEGAKDGQ